MVKRLILTFVLMFAAVFSGVFLSALEPTPAAQPQSGEEKSQSAQPAPREEGYYIIDYNGRVSILRVGDDLPDMIFDIYTRTLPQLDQEQLAEGVYVASYEELMRRIEDYIS